MAGVATRVEDSDEGEDGGARTRCVLPDFIVVVVVGVVIIPIQRAYGTDCHQREGCTGDGDTVEAPQGTVRGEARS